MISLKKRLITIIFLFSTFFIFTITGCAQATQYKKISALEAKAMIDGGGVIVLDVREQYEFDQEHIEDAILLPSGEIESRANIVLPNKDATILVYCRSGNRSRVAANLLISLGYKNVYDFGGIIDWPYGTVSP